MSGVNGTPDPRDFIPAAHDLGAPREDESPEAMIEAEVKLGFRCQGCRERITQGFRFTKIRPVKAPTGETAVLRSTAVSCVRPECGFALEAGRESNVVEKIETGSILFLDDERVAGMFNDPEQS